MKKITLLRTPSGGDRGGYILTRSVLAILISVVVGFGSLFAQTRNYASGDITGNRQRAGWLVVPLPGVSGVSKLNESDTPGYSALGRDGFYYGSNMLNSSTVSSSDAATLTASRLIGASLLGLDLLTVAGGDVYVQFRYSNTTNPVPAGTTSFVKVGARPTVAGLSVPVGGLLSVGDHSLLVGALYRDAQAYDATGGSRSENSGTMLSGTFQTKLVVNKSGEWFAGVTPSNTSDAYNSVRLGLRIPTDLLAVNLLNRTDVNVFNAFYITPGTSGCNDKPLFAGEGEATGLANLDLDALKLVSIAQLINNPEGAIDDNAWGTYSTIRSGVAGVSALGDVFQSFYFDHTGTASDEILLKLSVPAGILNATLLAGITIKAYKGNSTTPVNGVNGQALAGSLLGVNLANLLDVTIGGNTFKKLEVGIKPGAEFDRIELILDGSVLSLGVLANGLNIHDVALRPTTPLLTGTPVLNQDRARKVYVGQTMQMVTATSDGNTIAWYREGNQEAIATGSSPLNFPTTETFPTVGSFTYYSTAKKPTCDSVSARSPLYVSVLGVTYSNPPGGTQGIAYSNQVGFAGISGSAYSFTATTPGQLPSGLSLAPDGTISGTPSLSGTFTFDVAIQDETLGLPVGTHAYTLVISTGLAATPGDLPYGVVGIVYKDGTATVALPPATGGSGSYTYTPDDPGDLPPGLVLQTDGTITGNPTQKGTFTFTVTITDTGTGQMVNQPYTIIIGQPNLLLTTSTNITVFNATITSSPATLNLFNITPDNTLGTIRVAILVSSNFEIEYDPTLTSGFGGTLSNPLWTKSVDGSGTTVFTSTSGITGNSSQKIGFTYRKKATSTTTAQEVINMQIISGSGGDATTGNNKAVVQLAIQK